MMHRKVKSKIREVTKYKQNAGFLRSEEYVIKNSKITLNKNTELEEIYHDVNFIQLFKDGFMILHSNTDMETESKNIELDNINTIVLEEEWNIQVKHNGD